MKNLMTQKFVFGLLMALVLAFGVQGTAYALKFSRSSPSSSGDLQTVFANRDFKISFSVSSGSNTTAIKDTDGKLIKDSTSIGGAANHRIDSSGYLVENIGGTDYRESTAAQALTAGSISTDTSAVLVYKKGDTYPTAAKSNFVVNSSKAVYEKNTTDNKAYQVYLRTGTDPNFTYTTTGVTAEPTAKVPDANRYHYNEEALQITVPTNLTLKKINTYDVNLTATHTMNEAKNSVNENKITSSISLTYSASQVGTYDITISDETLEADRPVDEAPDLVFRVFVVKDQQSVLNTITSFESGLDGVEYGNDDQDWQLNNDDDDNDDADFGNYFNFGTEDAPVYYSVEGSGRLYIRLEDRVTSPTKTLYTSSDAPVYLDMSGGTNKVTAHVAGNTGRSAVFIFSGATLDKRPDIEITHGDDQVGVSGDTTTETPGGRLEDYLEVKVTDGKNRPVSGVAVKFEDIANDATSILIAVPNTNVYIDSSDALVSTSTLANSINAATFLATATKPAAAAANAPIFVQTDGSGLAKAHFQLGQTAGAVQIRASLEGNPLTPAPGLHTIFRATGTQDSRAASLTIVSGNPQSGTKAKQLDEPLVVLARSTAGYRIPGVIVQFRSVTGTFSRNGNTAKPEIADSNPPDRGELPQGTPTSQNPDTGSQIYVITDAHGRASVDYNVGQTTVARDVIAEVRFESYLPTAHQYHFAVDQVTFKINGGRGSGTTQPTQPTTITPYLQLSISPSSGAAGSTGTLTVTAYGSTGSAVPGVQVSLSSTGITLPSSVTSGQSTSFTFPSSTTSVTATASGYTRTSNNITVTGAPTTTATASSIEIVSGNNQTGEPGEALASPFTVRVEDASGDPIENAPVKFRITSSLGGSLSTRGDLTDDDGEVETILTFGLLAGTYTVEVEATEIDEDVTFTATAVPTPAKVEIVSGDAQEGSPGSPLLKPFVVKVTDKRKEPIAGETVTFREISNLGEFNNTTSSTSVTDAQGVAESPRMTIADGGFGALFVRATAGRVSATFKVDGGDPPADLVSVSGNNQSAKPEGKLKAPFVVQALDNDGEPFEGALVTFKVTGGGGKLSATSVKTDAKGLAQTFLTVGKERGENTVQASTAGVSGSVTFTAISGAEVLVAAAQRPPMYWIERKNGGIQQLVGDHVTSLATNIQGATSIALDTAGGYIYWTAQTGQNKGAIRRARLNGKGVQTIKAVSSLPMGIAVDSAGGMVYWTNAGGKILSIPVSGGKVTRVTQNLSNPGPIALSNGVLYWGEATGSVRKMSLTAKPKKVVTLATGLGEPLSLAIAKGKVFWIERGGGGSGKLQRVNTNGKNIQQLKAFASGAPIGMAVDSSANRIYWTKATGKIQRSNLAGKFIKDIVTGLPNPGSIALGVSGATTQTANNQTTQQQTQQTTQTTQQTTQQTTADTAYDVNGDGAVNDADVNAVALAVALGSSDATYDVNGDGSVDAKDLRAVMANTDDDAAAPAIDVAIDVTVLDVTRLHEQIALLLSTGDKSLATQRALAYLQQLLTLARPDETVLLANYPNPFNPETWIPYQLAESTDVKVRIYDAQGILVRELALGHQTAGYYTSRSRAAYWDGRNALGERVASGIYFYQLETDAMSPLRKMVILK